MSGCMSDELIARFTATVEASLGLRIPSTDRIHLERQMGQAAAETGFPDTARFVEWLTGSLPERETLELIAAQFTVGETYFYRDTETFRILKERIVPEIVARRRTRGKTLRIWSAGCATGEEPYSAAILLQEILPDALDWNITILGTDVNPRFLAKAMEGVYREWSFRDAPSWLKEKYFTSLADGNFRILPKVKASVDFRPLNLAEDGYPSLFSNTNAMDIVFCRNVLMYFSPAMAREVVRRIAFSLVDGGVLVAGPAELPLVSEAVPSLRKIPESTMLIKGSCAASPQFRSPRPVVQAPEESPVALADNPPDIPAMVSPVAPPCGELPAVDQSPRNGIERAAVLYGEGLYERAVETVLKLPGGPPGDPVALMLLARSYANMGSLDRAQEWCEKAVQADKLNPFAHYLLATILEERGDTERGRRELERVLYADRDFVLAHFALGHMALRQGRAQEGRRHLGIARGLLQGHGAEEAVPESEGISVGRLVEIIDALMGEGGKP